MKKLTQKKVNAILELHEKWLVGDKDGDPVGVSVR